MRHSPHTLRPTTSQGSRRRSAPVVAALAAVVLSVTMVACSDSGVGESPSPGGTLSPTGEVRAPNGTSMDATPINAGTAAGG